MGVEGEGSSQGTCVKTRLHGQQGGFPVGAVEGSADESNKGKFGTTVIQQ